MLSFVPIICIIALLWSQTSLPTWAADTAAARDSLRATVTDKAKPVPSLSLQNVVDTALVKSPKVLAAQAKLGISDAELKTATTRLNPKLVSDNGIAENTYRIGVEQTFELGSKRKRRGELAQANRQVVASEIRNVLLQVRTDVRKAFTQLYGAQQRQQTLQEITSITQTLLQVAQTRETAGDVAMLDVLQAEVAVINAKNDLHTAVYQVVQARNVLNILINQPLAEDIVLEAPPSSPSWSIIDPSPTLATDTQIIAAGIARTEADLSALIEAALANRPEVLTNRQALKVTDQQEALAKANRTPNATITSGYDRVTGSGGKNSVFIISTVELPTFNRQQGPIAEAQARRAQLLLDQTALNQTITLEVSNAFTQWQASQSRVALFETELLPKAETVMLKARRSFEVGKTPVFISISAQQGFIATKLGYLTALLDLQIALGNLEQAVGAGL